MRSLAHLALERIGDSVVARTNAGHDRRVVIAGHLAVASEEDPMAYVEMGRLFGPGACDAKGALAVALKAATTSGYDCDVTYVFYAGRRDTDGLKAFDAELRRSDVVLLAEPTASAVRGPDLENSVPERLVSLTDATPVSDASLAQGLVGFMSPVIAFGPGDPSVAGTPGEFVPTAELGQCEFVLHKWLTGT